MTARAPTMQRASIIVRIAMITLVATAAACASGPAGDDDSDSANATWVGTITTEGNVTTVVNESGSVWGGTATLVEEMSIGVDVGEDPYMLGYIAGLYATEDEILVLDNQVPVLRVYDYSGRHLRDIGRQGQGPGEFDFPFWVLGTPDRRIFVKSGSRVNVYSTAGESLDTIPVSGMHCCVFPPIVTETGVLYFPVRRVEEETRTVTVGLQAFGPKGAQGSLLVPSGGDYEPIEAPAEGRGVYVPFVPRHTWAAASWGAIVSGVSDSYRFEIERFDGQTIVVEKIYEPVPVIPEERESWRRVMVASTRRFEPTWTWDGAEIPQFKPPFSRFVPTHGERVWVIRDGRGHEAPDCPEEPTVEGPTCWSPQFLIDVFAADGRFLGSVEPPADESWMTAQRLFVRGRMVLMGVTDEAGTIMVKRYRLVISQ